MMREILFRGKRLYAPEWAYGSLTVYQDEASIWDEQLYDDVAVDPETVGQYTGLEDSNGQKIFDGDILELVQDYGDGQPSAWWAVVEFGNPNGLYSWVWQLRYLRGVPGFNPDILLWVGDGIEETGVTSRVIGNIHENPELVGKME